MKKNVYFAAISFALIATLMFSCGGGGGGADNAIKEVFTISYNANGAEYGVAPAKQSSDEDSPQAVQANTGNLSKSGYLFDGWNTAADGSGINYAPGSSYKGKNVVLYAKWAAIFNVEVINPGSPAPALNGAQQRAPGVPYIKILSLTARGKALASIVIPEAIDGYQVVSIGTGAFQGCDSVTELIIPNTVTSIENNAFSGCIGLSIMTIPSSVTTIGDGAFSDCAGLNSLIMLTATPPAMGTGAFEGCTATVSVPAAGVDDYKAAEGWNTYSASIAGYSNEIHTVTFDSQEATKAANPASIAVEPPNVTVGALPTAPERTGYLFGGWFKEPGGAGGEFTASTVVSSNMTVYAKWESYEYTVTFDDQGATTPASPTSKTVASPNTTVDSLPSEPENTGYYFGGWNTKADGTGTVFTANSVVTGDITVYAVWIKIVTRIVTFDSQDADIKEANPTSKSVVTPAVTVDSLPTEPVKTGYIFGGWDTESDGTGTAFTADTIVADDITVYAKWEGYEYTVTFDGVYATSPLEPTRKTVSSPKTKVSSLPDDPIKTGFIFDGWYTQPGGQGEQFTTNTVVEGNMTVYANWIALFTYSISSEKVQITGLTSEGKKLTSITIPSSIDGNPVTTLNGPNGGRGAFDYCTGITEIVLPNSIINIGSYSFKGCTGLTSITIPNSVTNFGREVFYGCTGLTSITISGNVSVINRGLFQGCTNLSSITLPRSVTSISEFAFAGCTGLTSITIPSKVTNIGQYAFSKCTNLSSITIPNSVATIGRYAFNGCTNLTTITIGTGLVTVEEEAFEGCTSLNRVNISDLESWCKIDFNTIRGKEPFATHSSNPLRFAHKLFMNGLEVTNVIIPEGITVLNGTFDGCTSLTSVTLPNSLASTGHDAFSGCRNITNVTIPNNVTRIDERTFMNCTCITDITIPKSITAIGACAFEYCPITNIILPNGVKSIGEEALNCRFTSIVIPESVQWIGYEAFSPSLVTLTLKGNTPPRTPNNHFFGPRNDNFAIKVPAESVDAYKAADGWSNYESLIVADE